MLKLFFVIITLATLAKSQITVEWICKETNSMGNCSTMPKISDLLQIVSEKSDNDEYTDFYYCPFSIAERHAKCVQTYFKNCYGYMSDFVQNIFFIYVPLVESPETLCIKDRPYKKEFREYTTCTKSLLEAEDEWEAHLEHFELQYGQKLENMYARDKCKVIRDFWLNVTTQIREECGSKAEKFARQVLRYIWPLSVSSKLCDNLISLE